MDYSNHIIRRLLARTLHFIQLTCRSTQEFSSPRPPQSVARVKRRIYKLLFIVLEFIMPRAFEMLLMYQKNPFHVFFSSRPLV